jgi:hypothetical protein
MTVWLLPNSIPFSWLYETLFKPKIFWQVYDTYDIDDKL